MISSKVKENFVSSFLEHLNLHFSRQAVDMGYLRNELIEIRRLDSLARLLNGSDSQNCCAICLYDGKLYIASNTDQLRYIKDRIEQVLDYIRFRNIPTMVSVKDRANKDLRKVVASLIGIGRRKVYRRTQGGSKSAKFDYKDNYLMVELINIFSNINDIILIRNFEGLHAELCVMNYLTSNKIYEQGSTILFGISKLCCKLCACAMSACGMLARQQYRAIHGNFYNNWLLPRFIKESKILLKNFLGARTYSIYKVNNTIRPYLLELIPKKLGLASLRGGSSSCDSDSEVE